jgi:glutamate-ammonia-ligase adenylyltransferase
MGAAARFEEAHRSILADVRGRFEKLFYRPMIQALAEGGASGLSEDALKERLHVLGFRDVRRAARVLEGLVSGGSRRAKLLRVLTPAMLRFLSSSPQPDAGLFGFLRLSEALQDRLDVLGSMRDNPPGIALLARVLGSGRFLGEVLAQVPEEIGTIADPQRSAGLKPRDQLVREAHSSLSWRGPERLLEGLRRFKRREMLRIALSDLAGEADGPAVGGGLSALAEACLEAAVADATIPFAVIGMGKLGGRELSYSSDLDVMFVFDGSAAEGERIAAELVRAISEVTPEGQAFRIDAGLRPEGKSGVLARSVESYAEYYSRWSQPWEHLASIKARAVAGDMTVANRLIDLTRELAFPVSVPASALAEIRHLKVRMEKERIPRAVDARRHSKLGPGGMTDIEFAAQLIQFQHGHRAPSLRVEGTLDALEAAASEGLLEPQDLDRLQDAYRFLMELRNRLFFLYGRPTDVLPVKPEEMEALGIAMGYSEQPRQELDDAYLRHTRRARKVAERIIFGAPA